MLLAFYYYDQIPETINLEEERFVLVHGFRGLTSESTGFTEAAALWQKGVV